jgi:hypothetical protein
VTRIKHGIERKSFWVDAVCIDQTSMPERNHQVRRMGKIYAQATDIIAWCDAIKELSSSCNS